MAAVYYQSAKQSLEVLDEQAESIFFDAPYSVDAIGSKISKLRRFLPLMRKLHRLVLRSYCVHSGLSWDWILPTEFASLLFGAINGLRTVYHRRRRASRVLP